MSARIIGLMSGNVENQINQANGARARKGARAGNPFSQMLGVINGARNEARTANIDLALYENKRRVDREHQAGLNQQHDDFIGKHAGTGITRMGKTPLGGLDIHWNKEASDVRHPEEAHAEAAPEGEPAKAKAKPPTWQQDGLIFPGDMKATADNGTASFFADHPKLSNVTPPKQKTPTKKGPRLSEGAQKLDNIVSSGMTGFTRRG